eukprot:gene6436-11880_t
MNLYSPISLVLFREFTVKTRPLVCKYQVVVVRKLWTSACCMFPRSEHFKYVGTAGETPKQMAVLAKKARKKEKTKRTRNQLGSILDEKVKADEMQEDIEEIVSAARKRLHLGDSQISSLHLGIDYLLSQKIPFNVVKKLCSISPKTIAQDMAILKKRITAFKVNSMYEDSMTKIFKKNPKILLLKLEDTLTVKVEALRRLPLGLSLEDVIGMVVRCPDIIEYLSTDKILEKISFLEKDIGFNKKQVRRIMIKSPAVLTMKMSNVKEKTDFCVKNFNVDLDKVAKYPRLFQCPMERFRQRHAFLEQEGLAGDDIKVKGWAFKAIAANSDVYFADKIAQRPLKKFRDFQEKWRVQNELNSKLAKNQ